MEEYTQRLTESSWDNKEWICHKTGIAKFVRGLSGI